MLDIKRIREDREGVLALLKRKEPDSSFDQLMALDDKLRSTKTRVEQLKSQRNEMSKQIGELKRKGENADAIMEEVSGMAEEIHALDSDMSELQIAFDTELATFANLPDEDVPISQDPADNVVIKEVGQKPTFSFPFKNHLELNEQLNLFDFERGAKVSGTGWPVYKGMGARLEWALINYMISIHIKNGFTQWMPPHLVRRDVMHGVGQLPKFEDQLFKLRDPDYPLYLIPTAEAVLNGIHMDEILEDEMLPLHYVAYTPCFRREAGAAGKQERGLIRVHQFNKVEMFCFTRPEESDATFEMMLESAEEILQGLGLHYRNALLVTGDMSFGAAKTVDVEVWLPGQDRYYEVSSVSNCRDYQSRRANIRRRRKGEKPELLHTLNGSGLATSRLMVAILENNQQEDGSVIIPEVLRPFLGGVDRLVPDAAATANR